MANLVKFRHFNTLSAFNQRTIAEGDLCFISEDKSIRTHSEVYMCSKDVKDIIKDNDNGLIISYNNGTSKTITLKGDFLKLSNSYIPNSSNNIEDLTVSAGDTVDAAIGKLAKLITLSNAATSTTLGTINDRLDALDQDFVTKQELTDEVTILEAADTALDERLDTIESSYVKSIKGASGSGSNTGLSITIGPTNKTTKDVNLSVTIDDTQLMSKISGVWHFKGVKTTISSLPSSGNQIGDVWQVIENNGEYAWDGTNWVELGSTIDLSEYKIKDLVQSNGDKGVTLTLNNNGKLNVSVTPGQIQNGNTSIITGGLVYNAIENLKGSATTNGDTLGKLENKINTLESVDMNNYYTKSETDSNFLPINTSIPQASNSIPLMDGIGSIGSANNFARADHRHPSDTTKQDVINDLADIRSGAGKGATAYQKPQSGIPKEDLASSVQTSLKKADSALQTQAQADWTENDSTKPSFIKNKPTIPSSSGDVNIIEEVQVNGVALTPDANKAVNVQVPSNYPLVEDTTSTSINATIEPNKFYVWKVPLTSNSTVTLGTEVSGVMNEYLMQFSIASGATPQVTFPSNLQWTGIDTFQGGKTYQVSIVNGYAIGVEFDTITQSNP